MMFLSNLPTGRATTEETWVEISKIPQFKFKIIRKFILVSEPQIKQIN